MAVCCAAAALACSPASAAPDPAPAPRSVAARDRITEADLRRDLSIFANDSFRGRKAGTPDAVRAAQFLAAQAAAIGLEPAGDSGTFLQRVPLIREYLGRGSRVTITGKSGTVRLAIGPRLLPVLSLGEDVPAPKLDADGDLLFAGYGLAADVADRSVSGKVVVFVMGTPPGLDAQQRAAMLREHPLGERLASLIERGPAGIIVVVSGPKADAMTVAAVELSDTAVQLGTGAPPPMRTLPMVLQADMRGATALLPPGWPLTAPTRAAELRHFSAHIDLVSTAVPAYNVVAIRRGGDAALRNAYVAFGAHLDHIGIQPPEDGDSVANGADDDGTGSVALLAIARAAVAQRPAPRRSMLFVWHTGEELGLYGSEWFTSHPTVPIDSIVAQLNADMIGRNSRNSLYLVGPYAAPNRQSAVLGAIADSVNQSLKEPFTINREWDSPTHPEQIYYRSDHYNYAKNGVPVVFFTTGLHADYHKVSDEVGKIEFDKVARVAQYMFDVGLAVADRPARPFPVSAHPVP
jgi:hypothetical protein